MTKITQIFDPALMKKKKKKKTPFDLDAALGESSADTAEKGDEPKPEGGAEENFDLEYFGKIKKKKKKIFNLDELENNLPSADADEKKDDASNEAAADDANNENDYDLDLDFSKTKKKKKKKKELVDLVAEKSDEQQQNLSDNGMLHLSRIAWIWLSLHQIAFM